MRSETDIKNLIHDIASNDNRVRAVLMNGSKVNPNIAPDRVQDFDIVFIVTELTSFTRDHDWVDAFGKILIRQLPDEMSIGAPNPDGFSYLMVFEDGNRIDLTLHPVDKVIKNYWPDSLTVCILDKDDLFSGLPAPNESDYFIKKPSEKTFRDVCNEFWWVSAYVAKGLSRGEITYAKEMLETVVRPMFMKLIEWKIGMENDFSVSIGKSGRLMHKYLPDGFYTKVLHTYSDFDIENNWKALFAMTELFEQISNEVSTRLGFENNEAEQQNAVRYLMREFLCSMHRQK